MKKTKLDKALDCVKEFLESHIESGTEYIETSKYVPGGKIVLQFVPMTEDEIEAEVQKEEEAIKSIPF